jgi:shikimate dehydrogenase
MDRQIYGIVGSPVKHSLSPAMQNAAFKYIKSNAEYRLFEVAAGRLEQFFDNVKKENNIAGLNITIPHKIKARDYLELRGSLDENAARLGAVNTIKICADGSLRGFNTDGPGFYRSLVEDLDFEPEGKNIFVLGSGGAAKAIVMYLGRSPGAISVFDVDGEKTESLKKHYEKYYSGKKLNIISLASKVGSALYGSDLLVNATPIGMHESDPSPVEKACLKSGMYVYDLVYNRPYTQLVKDAKACGARAVNGLGMLLYQGAAAFEIWTGSAAPVAVMKRALREALKKQGGT